MGDRRSSKIEIDHAMKLIKNAESAAPELVAELFCQLCKQLNNNPSPLSRQKGWKLFLVCLTSVSPSPKLLPHILAFCRDQAREALHSVPEVALTDELLMCRKLAIIALHTCFKATTSQMTALFLRGEPRRRKYTPSRSEIESIINVWHFSTCDKLYLRNLYFSSRLWECIFMHCRPPAVSIQYLATPG